MQVGRDDRALSARVPMEGKQFSGVLATDGVEIRGTLDLPALVRHIHDEVVLADGERQPAGAA
jgi:hypothetical protein